MQDLTTWSHLYSAGRLHKPVLHLASLSPTQPLTQQLHSNLEAALATALLMSPQQPSLKVCPQPLEVQQCWSVFNPVPSDVTTGVHGLLPHTCLLSAASTAHAAHLQ
jgi:hypothetical protein